MLQLNSQKMQKRRVKASKFNKIQSFQGYIIYHRAVHKQMTVKVKP